jgi:chemotaxis protein histidine kinase CheA
VRARAEQRGLALATREELLAALLQHGFSTLDGATSMSGRGIGLSAVAAEVERLGGALCLESETGQGTVLTIELPEGLLA